ncbi:SDR family NAD(P)-dependent oxidoreductase [Novosphingobium sp. BL-52-GroH]|uniref:SDR family NAD(P)-dependent oxidoreductase n=1 Tax=Novosphingobium sp. BL-52-GroH TaxID=3349877 RepID=UPI0038501940
MKGLEGKSIIVTGGGSGIGEAVSLMLGEAGCLVTVADLDADKAQAVAAAIGEAGGTAQAVRVDVADEASVSAMTQTAASRFGRLDGACNAAGVPQRGKALHEIELGEWDACHAVNLRGLFLCNKHEIRAMLDKGGAIVNIVSTSAMVGFPNGSEYCASKAGAMGLTRGAAIDYATKGIRINAVLPGGTLTPMLKGAMAVDPGLEGALAAVHPMNRFGHPSEIAGAVRWLLSDEASFATGASFAIDGGHTSI